jgi:hypothetical protein
MNFAGLHTQILKQGFTAVSNPLDDCLAAAVPNHYYLVWRTVWRYTVGWNKHSDNLSIQQISESSRVHGGEVSRALHFFQLTGLLRYKPGTWRKNVSNLTILPQGLPDEQGLERLKEYAGALDEVENAEKVLRRKDRHFRFTNAEFCKRVAGVAEMFGPNGKFDEVNWHSLLYTGDRLGTETVGQ